MKSPKITKIEIKKVAWEIQDCGPGEDSAWLTYNPGVNHPMSLFMKRMFTDADVIGEYRSESIFPAWAVN